VCGHFVDDIRHPSYASHTAQHVFDFFLENISPEPHDLILTGNFDRAGVRAQPTQRGANPFRQPLIIGQLALHRRARLPVEPGGTIPRIGAHLPGEFATVLPASIHLIRHQRPAPPAGAWIEQEHQTRS
jgi:hypothetical protein